MNLTSFEVGQRVFVRTVTNYLLGEVVSTSATDIVLENASWVGDTGRFQQFCLYGELDEVEPYEPSMRVAVPRTAIVDAVLNWPHQLPTEAN